MKLLALLIASILVLGCGPSPPVTPDMIEVYDGATQLDRIRVAAGVLKTLADEGLPDMSCTGDAEHSPRCQSAITPYELLVVVMHSDDGRSVFLQCRVSDDSDHPNLMDRCLQRIREELADRG